MTAGSIDMPARRGFLFSAALAGAAAALAASGRIAAAADTPDPLVLDTIHGLLAFIVPGPDAYSIAQGQTSPTTGGVDLGIAADLIATIDLTTSFVPHFSATVAQVLNGVALAVNPAPGGPFAAPFSNLLFAHKAAVFQVMDATASLAPLAGVLPPFVAFYCYSDADAFDPATRRLTHEPVGWRLSQYQGVSDGRAEFRGYLDGRR